MEFLILVVAAEQEEAWCSILHHYAQSVLLYMPSDADDATFGGMVAAQRVEQEHKVALLRIR